jgi:hypothetical protein
MKFSSKPILVPILLRHEGSKPKSWDKKKHLLLDYDTVRTRLALFREHSLLRNGRQPSRDRSNRRAVGGGVFYGVRPEKAVDFLLLIVTLANDRPVLSTERAPQMDKHVSIKH